MSFQPPALVFIAGCWLAMLSAAPALASDITIAPSPRKNTTSTATKPSINGKLQVPAPAAKNERHDRERPETKRRSNEKGPAKKAEKAKRTKKSRQREIVTHHLFNDPLTGKRKFGIASSDKGLGPVAGRTVLGSSPSNPLYDVLSTSSETPTKAGQDNGSGTPFDCREKPPSTSLTQRQLTACYVHKVDKSWRTETYLSRKYYDGSANWGGGLSVSYDY